MIECTQRIVDTTGIYRYIYMYESFTFLFGNVDSPICNALCSSSLRSSCPAALGLHPDALFVPVSACTSTPPLLP